MRSESGFQNRGVSAWVSALQWSLLSRACQSSSIPTLVSKLAPQLLIVVEIYKILVILLGRKRITQRCGQMEVFFFLKREVNVIGIK